MTRIMSLGMFLVLGLSCCFTAPLHANPFDEIVVFGESTSDTGNVFDLYQEAIDGGATELEGIPPNAPGYFQGRLSNGPVWVERLADLLQLPTPLPSRLGGSNYAYAGAKTGFGTNPRVNLLTGAPLPGPEVPRIGSQIDAFLADNPQGFNADQLVVIWGGANDLRDIQDPAEVLQIVGNLENHIRTAAANGAEHILVPDQLNAAAAPFFAAAPLELREQIAQVVVLLNLFIQAMVNDVSNDPTVDATIYKLNTYIVGQVVLAIPDFYGFTDTTRPGVLVDPTSDTFVFWDTIHPSRRAHTIIGNVAAKLVAPGEVAVKPFQIFNRVRLNGRGYLAVGIKSSSSFDARDVVPAATGIVGATIPASQATTANFGLNFDFDFDGDQDKILYFRLRNIRDNGSLTVDSNEAVIAGKLDDNRSFAGSDLVIVSD